MVKHLQKLITEWFYFLRNKTVVKLSEIMEVIHIEYFSQTKRKKKNTKSLVPQAPEACRHLKIPALRLIRKDYCVN